MGPRVILTEHLTMGPEKVGHLPLSLTPAATKTHLFSELKNASLISVGQLYDDDCQSILNKKYETHHSNRQAQHIRWYMGHLTETDSFNSTGIQFHCKYEQYQKIIGPIPPCMF